MFTKCVAGFQCRDIITANFAKNSFLLLTALMKVVFWLLHPDPNSRATLKDLRKDKWTNQSVDIALYTFESVFGER